MKIQLLSYSILLFAASLFLITCKDNKEKTKPTIKSITESVYASGIIKSKNQYQAFAPVNGIIQEIYVNEGDTLKKGQKILLISNETQKLNKENALLSAQFSDNKNNQGKLNDAQQLVELAKIKLRNDSSLFFRQKVLWEKNVGSKIDLDQKELNYQNSKSNYFSSQTKCEDLKRQIDFSSSQSKKNLEISSKLENDFTLKSEIDGVVFSILKTKGEMVSLQTPLAIIGDASEYILEMQVDEYDIFKIKIGQFVYVTLDSYKGQVFEAKVSKVFPIMNERSKSFLVEAEFINPPPTLLPNISLEANIVLKTKENALIIPRNYLVNDSIVLDANGGKISIKTGLKDYQNVEIIEGLRPENEIIKPK